MVFFILVYLLVDRGGDLGDVVRFFRGSFWVWEVYKFYKWELVFVF